MPALREIPATALDDIQQAVTDDGACIALNALAPELCDELVKDFSGSLDDLNWGVDEIGYRNDFYGNRTKRLHGLFTRSSRMVDVLTHDTFLAIARRMLVDTGIGHDIRLSNAELMVLGEGQANQEIHSDAASWHRAQRLMDEEILVSANCALTDFTATNGATRVVPGSHRWEAGRQPTEAEICLAIMPRGAALIYSGNVLHSGGANQEQQLRIGLYLGYVVSWLRPLENQLITNQPEDILNLPEDVRQLLDISPGGISIYA